jgi:hypothetical protein
MNSGQVNSQWSMVNGEESLLSIHHLPFTIHGSDSSFIIPRL